MEGGSSLVEVYLSQFKSMELHREESRALSWHVAIQAT